MAGLDLILPPSPREGRYACRYGDRVSVEDLDLRFEPGGTVFAQVHRGSMTLMDVEGAWARVRITTGRATLEGWSAPPLYLQRSLLFAGVLAPHATTPLAYEAQSDQEVNVRFQLDRRVTLLRGAPERSVSCDDVGPLPGHFAPPTFPDIERHDDEVDESPASATFEISAEPNGPTTAIVEAHEDDPSPFAVSFRQRKGDVEVAFEMKGAVVTGWTTSGELRRHDLIGQWAGPDIDSDVFIWGRDDSLGLLSVPRVCAHYAPLIAEHQGRRMLVGHVEGEEPVHVVGEHGPLVELGGPGGAYGNGTRWFVPRDHLYRCGALEVPPDHLEGHPPEPRATAPSPVPCLPTWTGIDARCLGPRNALELALVTVTEAEAAVDDGKPRRALAVLERSTLDFAALDHDIGLRAAAVRAHAYLTMGRLDAARLHADRAIDEWRDLRLLRWWRLVNDTSRRARAASAMGRAGFTQAEIMRISEVEVIRLEPLDGPRTDEAITRYWSEVAAPYFDARERAIGRVEDRYFALVAGFSPLKWKIAAAAAFGRMWSDLDQQLRALPISSFERYRNPYIYLGQGRREATRLNDLLAAQRAP